MKKIISIIALMLILYVNIEKEEIQSVFDEKVEYSNFYEITFLNNISTNNFLNYFKNMKIIWIKPKINILYENNIKKYKKYYFKQISNEKNIKIFKNEYINYINKLGYKNEALKLQTSGIMIEKIKIYLTKEELSYIKKELIDIKLENVT